MMHMHRPFIRRRSHRFNSRALSLVESVISVMLVAVLFVAALNTFSAAKVNQSLTAQQIRGQMLANSFIDEILEKAYQEPNDTVAFGREGSELSATDRSSFDDVDDFHGYVDNPVRDRQGTTLTAGTGWARHATVVYVSLSPQGEGSKSFTPVGTDQGFKLVKVAVYHDGRQVAELTAIRTAAR
jgi:type II secretory pathway pseudopilin PulG